MFFVVFVGLAFSIAVMFVAATLMFFSVACGPAPVHSKELPAVAEESSCRLPRPAENQRSEPDSVPRCSL